MIQKNYFTKTANMKTILVSLITMLFAFTATDKLTGRWESQPSTNGDVRGVIFKEDNTYDAYINKEPFVSGIYSFTQADNVFTLEDEGCTGLTGVYKINFFSNGDSMRFVAIDDNCNGRKEEMEKVTLGRVK
jgi:hypothetical protein